MATHVYGNPCDVVRIQEIADKYNLKVIYDGAHAFGVKFKEKSIFEFGDISICSTHATKLFHTTEGGFIVTKDEEQYRKMKLMRNFGFKDSTSFQLLGINAKNSEFHAAMGLVNLRYVDEIIKKRKLLADTYSEKLGTLINRPTWNKNSLAINSYYPVVFENEELLEFCEELLKKENITPRRYFYPSLSKSLPYVDKVSLPVADLISCNVLCLPLYFDLAVEDVKLICEVLNKAILSKKSV